MQQQLEALAVGVPADRRMRFRIGVHLGDVIEKADGSVYGDGVNIAARLEGLALPGGVTVSDAVQGAVRHRVAARFEDLGEQQVKNIADPVRAYRVVAESNGGAAAKRGGPNSIIRVVSDRRRWLGAAFVVAAVVLGAAAWLMRTGTQDGIAPITMSVAIGSIAAPANDSTSTQAAERLVQNLATGLGAVERHVRVVSIAGAASAALGSARAAAARYVVEGDLQATAPRRMLSLRLIESGRGTLAWSGRFDLPETAASIDSIDAQAAFRNMIRQLALAVENGEISRVLNKPVRRLDPMESVVLAWAHFDKEQSIASADKQRELLDNALRLDPTLVPALTMLFWQLDMRNDVDPHPDHERYVRESDEYSARAVTLDADNPSAWDVRATALMLLGRWNASLEAADRQIRLDPYSARAYWRRAWLLNMMGRPADALPLALKALELHPANPGRALRFECEAHLLLGAADKAIAACERSSGLGQDFIVDSFLAAAYANAGDTAHAQAALKAMLKTVPGYTIAQLRAKRYSDHPEYQKLAEKYWYDGLRKAGLPEQ